MEQSKGRSRTSHSQDQQADNDELFESSDQVEEPADVSKYLEDDIFDKILRGVIAAGGAVFSSAVGAGIIESATGFVINFESIPNLILTLVLFIPWFWTLTWMGVFRQENPDYKK